jgi:ABC-type amino acid transport substrate-binding protein
MRTSCLTLAALLLVLADASAQAPTEKDRIGLPLDEIMKPWTGDLDGMVERRMVRVLTSYSRTLYFIDRGTPRGTAYDQGALLEEKLNKNFGTSRLKVAVQFVPVSRNELIPALLAGKGDIVMADLTVTPDRLKAVDFVDAWIAGVDEIVVTRPEGPAITSVDDRDVRQQHLQELRDLPAHSG